MEWRTAIEWRTAMEQQRWRAGSNGAIEVEESNGATEVEDSNSKTDIDKGGKEEGNILFLLTNNKHINNLIFSFFII